MSLYCALGYDDFAYDWWWDQPEDEAPLSTKRSRRCCSCKARIAVGDISRKVCRYRPPTEFEMDRDIAYEGDEIPIASWYLCETCGDIADSLKELGYCYELVGESLADQIKEYREEVGNL